MSSQLFYLNISACIESLTIKPIGEQATNISTQISSAFIKDINNKEFYNSIGLSNKTELGNFYNNIILESSSLSSAAQYNESYRSEIQEISSNLANLFILCKYKNPSEKKCLSINNDGTLNTSDLIGSYKIYNNGIDSIDTAYFGVQNSDTFIDDTRSNNVYTEVREYEGIFLDKYKISLSKVNELQYPWDYEDLDYPNVSEKIFSSYRKCKVYIFVSRNYDFSSDSFYYSTFVLVFRDSLSEDKVLQDFTNADSTSFSTASSLYLFTLLYPFSVIVDGSSIESGSIGQDDLLELSVELPTVCLNEDGKINTDDSSSSLPLDTMACDLGGNIMIQYNGGPVQIIADQQLCGATAQTVLFKVDNVIDSAAYLYKDLPILTNALNVYAYNFTYLKYIKNDETEESFLGNGSLQTTTQKYENESLDLSFYFSYRFDPSYLEQSFIFTYKFKGTDGTNTTEYLIDFNPTVKIPTLSLKKLSDDKIQVISNYATKLIYYFENETPITVNITDSADGTNQITNISTVNKYGTLHVEVRNYFYEFDSLEASVFSSSDSILIEKSISIDSFSLKLYRGATLVNFYDLEGNVYSAISGTDFTQGSPLSYVYYFLRSSSDNFRFLLEYVYVSNLQFRFGEYDSVEIPDGNYYTISKEDLLLGLGSDKKVNLTALLTDGTEFTFPFYFKEYVTTTPTVSNVSIISKEYSDLDSINLTFSFDYSNSTDVLIEVINDQSDVIYSSVQLLDYSTSSNSSTITTEYFSLVNSKSISVKVTTRSLYASSGNETIRTASSSSSVYVLPLRLSLENPAAVKFYSDSSLTTEISNFKKEQTIYAHLILKAIDDSTINVSDYSKYISLDPEALFFSFESYLNPNEELKGVTFNKINNFTYSLNISPDSDFNENDVTINVNYTPIY